MSLCVLPNLPGGHLRSRRSERTVGAVHQRQGMALPLVLEQVPVQALRNEAGEGGEENEQDREQRLWQPGTEEPEGRAIRFCPHVLIESALGNE